MNATFFGKATAIAAAATMMMSMAACSGGSMDDSGFFLSRRHFFADKWLKTLLLRVFGTYKRDLIDIFGRCGYYSLI